MDSRDRSSRGPWTVGLILLAIVVAISIYAFAGGNQPG